MSQLKLPLSAPSLPPSSLPPPASFPSACGLHGWQPRVGVCSRVERDAAIQGLQSASTRHDAGAALRHRRLVTTGYHSAMHDASVVDVHTPRRSPWCPYVVLLCVLFQPARLGAGSFLQHTLRMSIRDTGSREWHLAA